MKKFLLLILMISGLSNVFAQRDCSDALVVCGNTSFENVGLHGYGNLQEVSSCGSQENNSIWLKIKIATSGKLSFNIIPGNPSLQEDFDFFLFYYQACNDMVQIRCSTTHPLAAGLSSNVTGTNDSETDEFEGPSELGNDYVKSVDVIAGDTYMLVIDRPGGGSNFTLEWTGTATFNDPPVITLPPDTGSFDIFKCDSDGVPDNSTVFDLTVNTPYVIGTQTDVAVSYYTNQGDCLLGINPIASPESFTNTTNPQTIYIRAQNQLTECSSTTDFQIGINSEVALDKDEYDICDNGGDGDSTNGQTNIDMDEVTDIVFPDHGTLGFTVEYYLTNQDAEDGVGQIASPFYNTVPGQQTVFIKVYNGLCKAIRPIDLIVHSIPIIPVAELVQCDYGQNPDGISIFNLSQADDFFNSSNPQHVITYYESWSDFFADTPISGAYTNTTNPQNIVVKITDNIAGCISTNQLILRVNTVTAQSIAPIETCDTSGNGFAAFNLNDTNVTLSGTETAAFYPSVQDALLQQNQISNVVAYNNTTAYNASVFVRIDDAVNGCSGISEIQLHVKPLPGIEENDEAYICTNLIGAQVPIDAGQLPSGLFTFEWKFNNSALPDTTYSINADQVGTYTVAITNADGCSNTRIIEVLPVDIPTIQSVTIDGNSVTINVLDLTAGNNVFSIDQPNGPFQQNNYFAVVPCGPHMAYVDGGNGCGVTSFPFEVMGIPAFFTPNGDGFGDTWNITCGENHPNTNLYIFDRFGKLLKQIGAAGLGWDGTYNGEQLPSDDYWYILHSDDGSETKGHFALKR